MRIVGWVVVIGAGSWGVITALVAAWAAVFRSVRPGEIPTGALHEGRVTRDQPPS